MKNLFRPTLAVLGLAAFSSLVSCKDYLEVQPTAIVNSATVFSSVSGAFNAVIGAYAPLSGDASYGSRISTYFPYDSEDFLNSPNAYDGGDGRRGIARYASITTNADVLNPWNVLYRGIDRANICIRYIPDMEQFQNASSSDNAAVRRLYGEALTLRAQYYLELTRNWGDVPAPFTPTVTGDDFNLPRSKRNDILDKLLNDLAVAEQMVPWFSAAPTRDERITKGAVKALRARIALYRAGYYFDPIDDKVTRATDYLKYYDTVRVECQEIINSNEHALNPSFERVFRNICEYQLELTKPEILFQVSMGGNGSASDSKMGIGTGPRSVNALNSPIGPANGQIFLTPTYFYEFDSTDTRRDITIAPYSIDGSVKRVHTSITGAFDGKFRREWCGNAATRASSAVYLSYNWPLIRYSDVLLMFAEADNELNNGPSAKAIEVVNAVRARGYGANTPPAIATDYTGFQAAVRKERLLEFGGEGIRKYDLIRWDELGNTFTRIRATLTTWANNLNTKYPRYIYYKQPATYGPVQLLNSYYKPSRIFQPKTGSDTLRVDWVNYSPMSNPPGGLTPERIADIGRFYTPQHQLLPIPATNILVNPNLRQNPGY